LADDTGVIFRRFCEEEHDGRCGVGHRWSGRLTCWRRGDGRSSDWRRGGGRSSDWRRGGGRSSCWRRGGGFVEAWAVADPLSRYGMIFFARRAGDERVGIFSLL
jgi:hypothetical protein